MSNFDILSNGSRQSISSVDITISSSLYETTTLFSFKNEALSENPNINSLGDRNTLYLAVDQNLWIISDLGRRTVSFEHQFSNSVEVFALVNDLLLFGLSNGEVHLLNTSLFKFVGSCCVSQNVWFDSKFFIGMYKDDESEDFLVLTKKGQLFRISCDVAGNLSSDMVTDLAHNITTAACSNGYLVAAGNSLIVYDLHLKLTDEISLEKEQLLKSVWPCHYSTFIGLQENGVLCKICPFTLCFMEMDTCEYISDFLMYMHSKNTYMYYISIVDSQQRIIMVEFDNDKEESFNLSTRSQPYLVYMNDEDENQLYLTREENNLHLNVIRETKPEDRFKRLILKMRFDEAEAFAKKYNLSPIEINKAKVSTYLEKLCTLDDIDDLLALLLEIPDAQYQFQICRDVSTYCACMEGLEKIVKFMSGLKYQDMSPPFDCLLNSMVFNYDTYQTVCRCENEEMSVNGYQDFNKNDLFEYLIALLRRGKMESAIIVCSRLGSTDFTHENVATVLKYVDSYHLREIASFLHTMIPNTLLFFPEARSIFCKMIIRKVYASERRCAEINFPEGCISFVDQTLIVLCGDFDNEVYDTDLTKELVDILKCLKTILELKNNFNLLLPLSVCLEGPGAMLRTLLGKNYTFEDDFLDKFLVKFMLENNLCPDTVLSKEITALLRCSPRYWISLVPKIWKSVSSISVRLELLLQMLHSAPKPWCNEIREMMSVAQEWNHPLVADVQSEAKNEPKYIVLYRREYGLEDETLESAETDTFVTQRMIYCNLPTLIADVYTLCTSEELKADANFLLMIHYIDSYELKNVFSLVNRFNDEERLKLVHDLCMFYRNSSTLKDVKLRRCLIQSLELLVLSLPDSNTEDLIDTYRIIDNLPLDMLHTDLFTILQTKAGRKSIKHAAIKELSFNTGDFPQFIKKCKTYGQVFCLSYEQVAFQTCSLTHDINLMHKCASYLCEHSEDPESLSLMSVLILRDIAMGDNDAYGMFFNDTIQTDSCGKPVDEKMLKDCLTLGRHMAAKASLLSENDLNERNVFVWLCNTSELVQSDVNQSSIYTMYQISHVFNRFCHYIQKSRKSIEYLSYPFPPRLNESEDDDEDLTMKDGCFNTILRSLEQALPSILRENQHWTVLKLLLTLPGQFELASENLLNQRLQGMIGKVKGNYLSQIFAAQTVKERDAFSLLLTYPQKKALKIITEAMQRYKLNFGKFEAIVKLGKRLTTFYKSGDPFSKTMLGIKWRKSLPDCSLSLNNFFASLSKDELLDPLITQNQLSIEQVAEFCIDFKLDAQSNYLKYLKHIITTWAPTYEIKVDICGNHTLDVKDSDVDLTTKCMNVVALINNRDTVLKCIDTLWKTTNVYYYEVFMAILSVAASLNDATHINFRMVLHFFRNYQRISKPSEVEGEEWCSRFMYKTLDPISEWRFPFSPMLFTSDLWKILRSEIKLSNYEEWFVLTDLLKYLTRNDICSFVVKDMLFGGPKVGGDCEEKYNLQPMFKQAFVDIDTCLAYITEPLLAASMSFHLVAKSPKGADRVTASKLAYKYAKICKSAGIDVPNYNQIETAYYTYAAIHILHTYKLSRPDYLALVDSPDELIEALYKDERIVMQSNTCLTQCPDINKATDELAALFKRDICAIRMEFLNTWLIDQNALMGDSNQSSICLMPDVNEAFDENLECVVRAAYLCSHEDSEFWRNHIFNLFQNTDENYPQVQGRLLKTMSMITSPEVFGELWECPYSDILKSIEQFFLIHDLRPMGVPIKVEHLGAIDHKKLLYKLGKKLTNPKAIKAMITVCDLYQEYDLNVCEKILQGLINLNMITELKKCIAKFKKLNVLIFSNVYVKAWQTVIDNTFSNLEVGSENFEQELYELLHFLQSSPVLNQLKLTAGVQICWKYKKYHFLLLLLQYEPLSTRNQYLRELLNQFNKETLLSSLESLQGKGFIGFEIVSQAIKNGLWVIN